MKAPHNPARMTATRFFSRLRMCRFLLSESRHQRADASGCPTLHDQRSRRLHIDPLARPKHNLTITGRPASNLDPAMDHKDGRLAFRHVNGPARPAYGRDGLRCVDLEFPAARFALNVKQQGLAVQLDGVD